MVISGSVAATLAGLSALTSIGTTAGNMIYNSSEAQKNRDFQKNMRDTYVNSLINQAEKNGISPSLLLGGGGSTPLGGSQASINSNSGGMSNSVNSFLSYMQNEKRMETLEEMQEDKLQVMKEIARMRNSTTNAYVGRNYTSKELDNLYNNLDEINL